MEKWFKVYNTLDEFKTQKLSINQSNTEYITYENPVQIYGTPDVNWNQIVFVLDDTNIIYCKGKILHNLNDLILDEQIITYALLDLNDKYKTNNRFIDSLRDSIIQNHNIILDIFKNNEIIYSEGLNNLNARIGEDRYIYTSEDEQVINGDKNAGDIKAATGLYSIIRDLDDRITILESQNN